MLGSIGWAVAGGVIQAVVPGTYFILWSLGRKPTGPYHDTSFVAMVTGFALGVGIFLGVVIGLLVAAGFWLAGVRPAAGSLNLAKPPKEVA